MAASESNWGMCKDCQWWQIDPGAPIADHTMGVCTEDALQPFRLRVSGTSGCNHYTPGEPTHAATSSGSSSPTQEGWIEPLPGPADVVPERLPIPLLFVDARSRAAHGVIEPSGT